ncbi:hypothetical protein V8E54_004561 [Elaphomyces granulatus]
MKLLDLASTFSLLILGHASPVPNIPITDSSCLQPITLSGQAPLVPDIHSAGLVRPTTLSPYTVSTGAINFNAPNGVIFKNNGQSSDITTLVTFNFPSESQGKTCSFHFFLDPSAVLSGSGLFDVFTSLAPATHSTDGFPPGNQRNQQVARMQAVKPGEATYVSGFPNSIQSFPCPSGVWPIELVGVFDVDNIQWLGFGVGPYVTWS